MDVVTECLLTVTWRTDHRESSRIRTTGTTYYTGDTEGYFVLEDYTEDRNIYVIIYKSDR